MPIELYWDNDERSVMLIEVSGAWTWDEMYHVLETIKAVTDRSERVIAAILDLSAGVQFPGGSVFSLAGLGHARRVLKMGEDGTGPIVIAGAGPFIRRVYDAFYPLDRRVLGNIHFAPSVDTARRLLQATGEFSYNGL